MYKRQSLTSSGLKQTVSDDEKLSRTIKIIAVSKFIKEIVRKN